MKRPTAGCGPITIDAVRLIDDEPCAHAVFINRAQRSCKPLNTATGVRRTIKRIHHYAQIIVTERASDFTFFGQNRDTRTMQNF